MGGGKKKKKKKKGRGGGGGGGGGGRVAKSAAAFRQENSIICGNPYVARFFQSRLFFSSARRKTASKGPERSAVRGEITQGICCLGRSESGKRPQFDKLRRFRVPARQVAAAPPRPGQRDLRLLWGGHEDWPRPTAGARWPPPCLTLCFFRVMIHQDAAHGPRQPLQRNAPGCSTAAALFPPAASMLRAPGRWLARYARGLSSANFAGGKLAAKASYTSGNGWSPARLSRSWLDRPPGFA